MASAKSGVHIMTLDLVDINERLTTGEKFLKWSEQDNTNNACPIVLKVDPNGFFLFWQEQNKEIRFLDISQIRDIRSGSQAKVPKDSKVREIVSMGDTETSLEDKTVTVAFGTDFVNINFINFCSKSKDVAKYWTVELWKIVNNVLAANISSLRALEKIFTQITLTRTSSGDSIPIKSILKLFAQNKDDRKLIEKALDRSGLPSHKNDLVRVEKLQFQDFFNFYTHLVKRTEVEEVFTKLCNSKRVMSVEEFKEFVNSQRDPRLGEILYPYCTLDKARDLIKRYEPNQFNVKRRQLSFEGFLRYLLSEENQIVSPELFDLHNDMTLPLSHYFIQSSHNTYLTGHQWTGKSSVEMYRQVLLAGCRCIELDLWDGKTKEEEPVIVHGYTLVPEILAKDVIMAIAESAFKTSDFPVILSFENHCKPKQQAKIATYCREYFGDMLLKEPLDAFPLIPGHPLPSPMALRGKILIKNKKKHKVVGVGAGQGATTATTASTATTTTTTATTTVASDTRSKDVSGLVSAIVDGHEPGCNTDVVAAQSLNGGDKGIINNNDDLIANSGDVESDENSDSDEEGEISKEKLKEGSSIASRAAEKEAKAAEEISALVNYVQAVRFHTFEQAERKNRSYEMSSFDEANAVSWLKEFPIDFVKYNKRQLSRIFPKGTRLDSSNFMPQVFWNTGCQLVALNYQNLDLPMQLNLGIFEFNRKSGYLQKPIFMCREDRMFDPFADTSVDGIIPGKVSIQILSGQFLTDKHVGTYVEVDMFGLPCDTTRRKFRTKVVPNNGIFPRFTDEPFVFNQVVLPDLAVLRVAVYEESGKLIGHRVLPVKGIRPGYRHFSLRNESGQFLTFPTLFVYVKVQDYVPDRFSDFAEALANPIRYQSELEKRTQQLKVLTEEEEGGNNNNGDDDNNDEEGCSKSQKAISSEPEIINEDESFGATRNKSKKVQRPSTASSVGSVTAGGTTIAQNGETNVKSNAGKKQPLADTLSLREKSPHLPSAAPSVSTGSRSFSNGSFRIKTHTHNVLSFKRSNTNKGSKNIRQDSDITAFETNAWVPLETVEACLNHKAVLEKIAEKEKKMAYLNKKYQKDVDKIKLSLQAKEQKTMRGGSSKNILSKTKLVKILSEKTLDVSSPTENNCNGNNGTNSSNEEKLAQIRAHYEEKIQSITVERDKCLRELEKKYSDMVLSTAEKQLKLSQQSQLKQLEAIHEKECAEMMKKLELQAQEEIRDPKEKDKEEMLRLKKEKRSFIVKRGLEERRKLNDSHKKKLDELAKKHEEMRKTLFNEINNKQLTVTQ